MKQPLAYRLRPKHISEVIGQKQLIGPGALLTRMIQAKRLAPLIFYGPPGVGKTSLAQALSGTLNIPMRTLNAATDSKKDLMVILEETKISGTILLFIDEIHRLDKVKQDFLLPFLERGACLLIGATTENPLMQLTPALRSRVHLCELFPLSDEEIKEGIQKALTDPNGLSHLSISISPETQSYLATHSSGDLRSALNALELAVYSTPEDEHGLIHITPEILKSCLQKKTVRHDLRGDQYYHTISAFQKSIRGSDVDAALHYLARLLHAGELNIVCRRLLVTAYEDISFGNPDAVSRTLSAIQAAERLGMPEARIPLAHAVIDLCLSPKSNTAYQAINLAFDDLEQGASFDIPKHLHDPSYIPKQEQPPYLYPHDYPMNWVHQEYLPKGLKGRTYYIPKVTGKYEQALHYQKENIQNWKKHPPSSSRT